MNLFIDRIATNIGGNSSNQVQHSFVLINNQRNKYFIQANQVVFIKADSNYSTIHFMANEMKFVFTSKTLKHWFNKFNSDLLIKVHSGYLVNTSKIQYINKANNTIAMEGGIDIPFSRRNRSFVKSIIR